MKVMLRNQADITAGTPYLTATDVQEQKEVRGGAWTGMKCIANPDPTADELTAALIEGQACNNAIRRPAISVAKLQIMRLTPSTASKDCFLFHAGLSFLKTLVSLFQQLCTVGSQLVEAI
jgi:hypothetical protein